MFRPWLAHYDYWIPHTLVYPERPLWEILDSAAVDVPESPATLFLGATLTYRELKFQSDWLAFSLGRLGLRRGDRVAVMLPNCPQYVIAGFAILRLGAIVVNINPSYSAREVQTLVDDSNPRALITLDSLVPLVQTVRARSPFEHLVVTSLEEYAAIRGAAPRFDDTHAFAVLAQGDGLPPVTRTEVSPDDVAVLQYTGGTTGTPKGAMLTHRSLFANVIQAEAFTFRTRLRGTQRYLMVIPYFHAFGFTIGLLKGTWVGAMQILVPKFNPDEVLDLVEDSVPTYFPAVPTLWSSLLSHPRASTSGLDRVALCTSGGSPCPPELLQNWERAFGRTLYEGFGLSEASPITHSMTQLGRRKPGTIGVPMPDTDIEVVDLETGRRALGPDEPGELCIHGPQLMKGYWNRPEETARALQMHADGRVWLHTGDIAVIDRDGFTRIVQRKKDMVIVDGYNVYPSEVEAVLHQHPDVTMAAVIGMPHRYHGEVVRAFVVLKERSATQPADVIAHCREHLAPYKVPRQVDIRTALPMTAVGKVLYRVLREEAASASSEPA